MEFLIVAMFFAICPGKLLDDWLVGRCLSYNAVDRVDLFLAPMENIIWIDSSDDKGRGLACFV